MKKIFTLISAMFIAATTWAGTTFTEVKPAADALDGLVVVGTDLTGDNVLASANWHNQDLQSYSLAEIKDGADDYCWKFAKVTDVAGVEGNLYTIQNVGKNGKPQEGWWNPSYIQETGGGAYFRLGFNKNKYGEDGEYYGLWSVTYEEENGYVIYNVGKANYLNTTDYQAANEKTYIRLFEITVTAEDPVGLEQITPAADALDGLICVGTGAVGDNVLISITKNQDIQSASYAAVKDGEEDYCWKFAKVTDVEGVEGNLYTIQIVDKDGKPKEGEGRWWLPAFLQETPTGAYFRLWFDKKYGQDGDLFGLWSVAYEDGKGYTIYNVGKQNYLTTDESKASSEKTYIRLFTGKDIATSVQNIKNTYSNLSSKKFINNGNIVIMKNGQQFNVAGQALK